MTCQVRCSHCGLLNNRRGALLGISCTSSQLMKVATYVMFNSDCRIKKQYAFIPMGLPKHLLCHLSPYCCSLKASLLQCEILAGGLCSPTNQSRLSVLLGIGCSNKEVGNEEDAVCTENYTEPSRWSDHARAKAHTNGRLATS